MKKIKYLIFIILIGIISLPIVFAKDEVSIESYELVKNSVTTVELNKPKIDGLTISFDLSFVNKDDFAKYKIVVNNPTNIDYEVNKDSDFNKSEYITYSYEFENNNNIVKANSKMTMYVTITYSELVPVEKMKDGKFTENNKMAISLSTDTSSASMEEKEENPNTGNAYIIICSVALTVAAFSLILFVGTKKKKYITTCFLSLLLIPTTIFALEKIQINVETKVTIEEKYGVYYAYSTFIKESEKNQYSCVMKIKGVDPVYIVNGERYVSCDTFQLESMYKPGERVQVNKIPFKEVVTEEYNGADLVELCTLNQETNEYTCESDALKNSEYDYMKYSSMNNPTYQVNDIEVMNISIIENDAWNSDHFVTFFSPNEFTMPKHDVVLKAKVFVLG